MKKTTSFIAMAVLCLNFCFGQVKSNNSSINKPYKYGFSSYKSGYKPGYRISTDEFMRCKSITVRNYTITHLFALALGAGDKTNPLIPEEKILLGVRQPSKLKQLKCFQLIVPFHLIDNFYVIMQQSLNEEFPEYIVKMQKFEKECYMVIEDKEY